MDLLLDRSSGKHDLVFVNGECPTTGDIVDRVIQRLYIRLRTFFGEWWWDVTYGVPWLERILGQKNGKTTADIVIQEQILEEDGVQQILEFSSSYDNANRSYSCSFRVRTEGGQLSPIITI